MRQGSRGDTKAIEYAPLNLSLLSYRLVGNAIYFLRPITRPDPHSSSLFLSLREIINFVAHTKGTIALLPQSRE